VKNIFLVVDDSIVERSVLSKIIKSIFSDLPAKSPLKQLVATA